MIKLAIDVGGVLIEKKTKYGPDTNFDVNDTKWLPGSLEAIKTLCQIYDVYILSFCGKRTELETRQALRKEVASYVPENKWIFTREREYKVDRMKSHGLSILVDDTEEIINWVNAAGFEGVHFGSGKYPDWSHVVEYLVGKSAEEDGGN